MCLGLNSHLFPYHRGWSSTQFRRGFYIPIIKIAVFEGGVPPFPPRKIVVTFDPLGTIYKYLEPQHDLYFWRSTTPPKQGLNSNQNRGHFGSSRYLEYHPRTDGYVVSKAIGTSFRPPKESGRGTRIRHVSKSSFRSPILLSAPGPHYGKWSYKPIILLMDKILHQLRLVVYPIIYNCFIHPQVVVWDFSHQQYEGVLRRVKFHPFKLKF